MAGGNVPAVGVEITARLDKFRTEMSKLGPEAGKAGKQIAAQLEREWKASQKAMRDTERVARETNAEMRRLVDSGELLAPSVGRVKTAFRDTSLNATQLGMAMGPLGGVLAKIDPQAGAVASTIAGLTGTFGGLSGAGVSLGAAVGPVAVVLGAVAAAALPLAGHMAVLAREEEQAAARADLLAQSSRDLAPSLDAINDAALRAAVATGRLTEEQGKLQAAQDAASKSTRDLSAANDEQRAAANEAYFTAQKWLGYADALPAVLTTAIDYYGGYSDTMRESTRTLRALGDEEAEHQDNVAAGLALTTEAIVAEGKKSVARDAGAEATRRAADAERELSDAIQASNALAERNAATYLGVVESLRAAEDQARASTLDGIAAIEAARDAELEALGARYAKGLVATQEGTSAREELDRQHAAAGAAIVEASEERVLAIRQEAADADAKLALDAARVREEALMHVVGSSAAALGELFGDSKAAAFATASVNAALAITQALASLPPPFGAIEAAIIGGVTAGQLAKIQSTEASFGDTPGVVRMEDGGSVRLAAGDHFAAAQSREELQRQVVGASPVVRVVAETHYRHQSFDRFVRDNLRTSGPLGTAIRGSTRVGHREV